MARKVQSSASCFGLIIDLAMIETPAEIIMHYATAAAAISFIAWRKRIRKPLTETAALRLAKTLATIRAKGGDPDDALGMAEERGWMTIKEDWYFGQRTNGKGNSGANATLDAITIGARAHRAPSADRL